MAVASRDRDEDAQRESPHVPWHNRTSAVIGASLAGLAAIGILVVSINYVVREVNQPVQAPINYVGPANTSTASRSSTSTATATATIISTSPPVTTDINPDLTPSSTPESSESSSRNPNSRPPRTREPDEDDATTTRTTRNRPRTNVTRTLNPVP